MTIETARLGLALLEPGQAQKEMFHNEALARIDVMLHASVVSVVIDVPPTAPVAGECWVIGATPTGAWAGYAGAIAGWTAGGWRFVLPLDGMTVWNRAVGLETRFGANGWTTGEVPASAVVIGGRQVVGARLPDIAGPAGGAIVDAEARAAIDAILTALRGHGLIG